MVADREVMDQILKLVPQQHPFRFIDEILYLDEEKITGAYRFRENEYFYRGHFPDHPITPGVILIETMAQTGVVAFGIYLTIRQKNLRAEQIKGIVSLFTLAEEVEFLKIVYPGERVIIHGKKVYFRKGNLRVKIRMEKENREMICCGVLSGTGESLENL